MSSYAQTIIQLYNQLQDQGYNKSDILIVRDTYAVAMSVFSGHFQPSGKTFIAHGVGTASILASLKQSAHLISAGLIHNIYMKGDFGTGVRGISKFKKKYLRNTLGSEIEGYAAGFAKMRWNLHTVSDLLNRLNDLDEIDKDVILIYLADHLEHLLDMDALYFDENKRQRYTTSNLVDKELSYKLGFSTLASEFERMGKELELAAIPVELVSSNTESFTVPPKSYRKRIPVLIKQSLNSLRSKIKVRKIFKKLLPG